MPADPYTVVGDALRGRWPEAPLINAIASTAIRALLAAGYQIIHEDPAEAVRMLVICGALEQVGWRFEAVAPRSATEPRYGLMTYLSGEAGHADHEPVFRLVTESDTDDG